MNDHGPLHFVSSADGRRQGLFEVERTDQMHAVEKPRCRGDLVGRHRQRAVRQGTHARGGGEEGKRIVMLSVLQQRADDVDLDASQQRVAIRRRFAQKDPIAPLRLRCKAQFGAVAQRQVLGTFVQGRGKTGGVAAGRPGRRIAKFQHQVTVRFDTLGRGRQHQVALTMLRRKLVRRALPSQVGAF